MVTEARRLLNLTEAAVRLRIHPNTLRKWVDAGRIPAVRRPGGGGFRRFDSDELDRVRREMGIPEEPKS